MIALSNRFDAALNAMARNDPETKPWLRTQTVTSEEEQQAFWDQPRFGQKYWTVENTLTKELVGIVGFTSITKDEAEFSCLIYPGYRKQGYGAQALEQLFDQGFYGMGLSRIYGWTYGYDRPYARYQGFEIRPESFSALQINPAIKLFQKLGMEIYGPCLWPKPKEQLSSGQYVWRLEMQKYDYSKRVT
jgi:GNAT superfamily N-acetyltransferase